MKGENTMQSPNNPGQNGYYCTICGVFVNPTALHFCTGNSGIRYGSYCAYCGSWIMSGGICACQLPKPHTTPSFSPIFPTIYTYYKCPQCNGEFSHPVTELFESKCPWCGKKMVGLNEPK